MRAWGSSRESSVDGRGAPFRDSGPRGECTAEGITAGTHPSGRSEIAGIVPTIGIPTNLSGKLDGGWSLGVNLAANERAP